MTFLGYKYKYIYIYICVWGWEQMPIIFVTSKPVTPRPTSSDFRFNKEHRALMMQGSPWSETNGTRFMKFMAVWVSGLGPPRAVGTAGSAWQWPLRLNSVVPALARLAPGVADWISAKELEVVKCSLLSSATLLSLSSAHDAASTCTVPFSL